jgi:diphthine-ammonia ligase
MSKAFVSWSGGKDCCQCAYKARQSGFEIGYLMNMINPEVERSCSHGIAAKWIKLQSEAMGIPIVQQTTRGQNYADQFVAAIQKMRAEGMTHGIFGDIDFNPHREWVENVCKRADVEPVLPLWNGNHLQIVRDFIEAGFTTIVVAVRSELLGEEWVGRVLDQKFLKDLEKYPGISACGEAGEFHTLVVDGPLFKQKMVIRESSKIKRMDHWILDIQKIDLAQK